jgi:hypothetical protein
VLYQTDLFLDKNRDYVIGEHQNLLCSSKCSFISGLFAWHQDDPSKSSYKFSSVASRFKVAHTFFILKFLNPFLSVDWTSDGYKLLSSLRVPYLLLSDQCGTTSSFYNFYARW